MTPRHERMSDEFEKLHLGNGKAIHHFTGPDRGGPHDHPSRINVFVKAGGYVERMYQTRSGHFTDIHRKPGDRFTIEASRVHEIIHLPEGECWTEVTYEPHTRETHFWRWNGYGNPMTSRLWFEKFDDIPSQENSRG